MKKKKTNDTLSSSKNKVEDEKLNELEGKDISKGDDKSSDDDLPGYPHYPAEEDIMNPANNFEKGPLKEEGGTLPHKQDNLTRGIKNSKDEVLDEKPVPTNLENDIEIVPGTEADVTKEDLELLGSDELNVDLGEDEELKKRVYPVDMAGEDLDVPGAELDDAAEDIGEEDEENNNYSIGGDRHEDLEEDPELGR